MIHAKYHENALTQTTTNKATTEEKQLSSELALIKVSSDLPQLPEVASL